MTPPIDGIEITDSKKAESLVSDLDIIEKALLLKALEKGKDSLQKKDYERFLNKPNMTNEDKANMEKSIEYLMKYNARSHTNMNTLENLKKLDSINYGLDFIEIGGIKRARNNLTAKPNNKDIFKRGNEVYFGLNALEEQNKLLANKGMEIPQKKDFIQTLKALPGDFNEQHDSYWGGNILGILLGLQMSGFLVDNVVIADKIDGDGFICSYSKKNDDKIYIYKGEGGVYSHDNKSSNHCAYVVRPILKNVK